MRCLYICFATPFDHRKVLHLTIFAFLDAWSQLSSLLVEKPQRDHCLFNHSSPRSFVPPLLEADEKPSSPYPLLSFQGVTDSGEPSSQGLVEVDQGPSDQGGKTKKMSNLPEVCIRIIGMHQYLCSDCSPKYQQELKQEAKNNARQDFIKDLEDKILSTLRRDLEKKHYDEETSRTQGQAREGIRIEIFHEEILSLREQIEADVTKDWEDARKEEMIKVWK